MFEQGSYASRPPSDLEEVVKAMCGRFAIRDIGGGRMEKAHGRYAFTLSVGWGECAIDLSFVPTGAPRTDDPRQMARDFLSRVVDITKTELTYTELEAGRFEKIHVLDRNLSYYVRMNGGVGPGSKKLTELGWVELGLLLQGAAFIGHSY